MAQISITASTYLIVAASAERYFTMAHTKAVRFEVSDRFRLTAAVLLFAIFSKVRS